MKIVKPDWINDATPIITCDIHPDGSRFALGGSTKDAGKIQIWNMAPILDEGQEKSSSTQKLLCSMYNHMACVNCVRWSLSGKYLASGADDRLVMIWSFGGMAKKGDEEQENWKCIHRLQCHESDVIDLAWNRNDKYLASASLDSTIVVWNSNAKFERVAILKGHGNFVKGVTWDPVGSYLASQSTDNTVRVWNTVDWTEETKIEGPFLNSGSTGHVMRIGWSPDGTYIIAGGAVNNGGPSAQIISRKWELGFDLVGHRKAVSCVRFAPTCYRFKSTSSQEQESSLGNMGRATPCCALGSRDRSLSVWLSSFKRPLVVIHDLFEDSILDLSWDASGSQLMACSWDGTIAVVTFRTDEIGEQMSFKEMTEMLDKYYGSSMNDITEIVIENPAMMHLKDKAKETKSVDEAPKGPKKQIITKRKDGKKRITPAFIGGITASTPRPFGAKENVTPTVEEPKSMFVFPSTNGDQDDKENKTDQPKKPDEKKHKEPEKEKTTPEPDQKTLAPPPPPPPQPTQSPIKKSKLDKTTKSSKVNESPRKDKSKAQLTDEKEPEKSDKEKRKRKRERKEEVIVHGPSQPAKSTSVAAGNSSSEKKIDSLSQIISESDSEGKESTKRGSCDGDYQINQSVSLLRPLSLDKVTLKDISLRHQLNVKTEQNGRLVKLISGKNEWTACFDAAILTVKVYQRQIHVLLQNGELCVLNGDSGARCQSSLYYGQLAFFDLTVNGHLITCTIRGDLLVRQMPQLNIIHQCSVLPLIGGTGGVKMENVWIGADEGASLFVRIGGVGIFVWNERHHGWHIYRKSVSFIYGALPDNDDVKQLMKKTNNDESAQHDSLETIITTPSDTTSQYQATGECVTAHLEEKVNLAFQAGNGKLYRKVLLQNVRHLVQVNDERRLRQICDSLLGPVHQTTSDWSDTLLGTLSKAELLSEAIALLGSNLRLQRLYSEYEEMIEAKKLIDEEQQLMDEF